VLREMYDKCRTSPELVTTTNRYQNPGKSLDRLEQ